MAQGSLIIVGTGIRAIGQTTLEALGQIQRAEKLLYLVGDPVTSRWLEEQNPTAESLARFYAEGKPRIDSYREIVRGVMDHVRSGLRVCVVSYGHPGVFAYPTHEAIRQARAEGFSARMLPGVSAEDCLFADLGVDPGRNGCQSYEATDFLVFEREVDPRVALVIWQVGLIGQAEHRGRYSGAGVPLLVEKLESIYGPSHEVTVYEAALYPICDPAIERVPLCCLPEVELGTASTLYVPPRSKAKLNTDLADRLRALLGSIG